MYTMIPDCINSDQRLTPGEKLCFCRLMRYGATSGRFYPSYTTIAREIGLTARQVKRILASLREKGLVTWTTGRSNHYSLRDHCHECHDILSRAADKLSARQPTENTLPEIVPGQSCLRNPDLSPEIRLYVTSATLNGDKMSPRK